MRRNPSAALRASGDTSSPQATFHDGFCNVTVAGASQMGRVQTLVLTARLIQQSRQALTGQPTPLHAAKWKASRTAPGLSMEEITAWLHRVSQAGHALGSR